MKLQEEADRLVPEMREKIKAMPIEDHLSITALLALFRGMSALIATDLDLGSVGVALMTYGAMIPNNEVASLLGSVFIAFNENVAGFDDVVKGFEDDGTQPPAADPDRG